MRHGAEWARRSQRDVRALLNDWDPLGVFDPDDEEHNFGVADEYDCTRNPLISHLLRGDSRADVAQFLRDELTDHFGLEPWLVTTDLIDRIFDWWVSVK